MGEEEKERMIITSEATWRHGSTTSDGGRGLTGLLVMRTVFSSRGGRRRDRTEMVSCGGHGSGRQEQMRRKSYIRSGRYR